MSYGGPVYVPPHQSAHALLRDYIDVTHPSGKALKHPISFIEWLGQFPVPGPHVRPCSPIRCIAMQGGGAKIAGYPGAISILDKYGYLDEEIQHVAGTSAGAITAFFLGLGFNGRQIATLMRNIDLRAFQDVNPEGFAAADKGDFAKFRDFAKYGAVYEGKSFKNFINQMLNEIVGNENATFEDLQNLAKKDPTIKNIAFVATRLGQGNLIKKQVFSAKETPNVRISDALCASMAYPGAYKPVVVRDKQGKELGVFVDGGLSKNLPMDVFNDKEYQVPHYPPVERQGKKKMHLVNPCAIGISLVSLKKLNKEVTPWSPELELHIAEYHERKAKDPKSILSKFKSAAGKTAKSIKKSIIPEDVQEAHEMIYPFESVQVWNADIKTFEFDVGVPKRELVNQNSENAMRLWLENFKNPMVAYDAPFEEQYEPLDSLMLQFIQEMEKVQKQAQFTPQDIHRNVRLCYLGMNINRLARKEDKNVVEDLFEKTVIIHNQRKKEIEFMREFRECFIHKEALDSMIPAKILRAQV